MQVSTSHSDQYLATPSNNFEENPLLSLIAEPSVEQQDHWRAMSQQQLIIYLMTSVNRIETQ